MSIVGMALNATLLAALFLRGRYRACLSFTLYAVAVLVPQVLFTLWPARFFTWDIYFLRENVHSLLKLAIALELGYRTFRAFPGALVQARRVVFAILALVGMLVIGATASTPSLTSATQVEWHARVLSGTIWLLTGIAAVILWYRLPVDSFHKAILVGFVPYLLLFSIGMEAMLKLGQAQSFAFQRAHGLAYIALLFYWNRAAWAPAPMTTLAVSGAPRQFENGATGRPV